MKTLRTGLAVGLALSGLGTAAQAHIPSLNASCPTGIEVHADEGGPVYINGEEAQVSVASEEYFEAVLGDVSVSIMIGDDGTATASYTSSGGANGICQINDSLFGRMDECPVDVSEADRYLYPACN